MALRIAKKHKILAIKNRAIGDTILMTGPLRILRQHYPLHEIHVLVRYPAGEVLEGLPFIDRVVSAAEPPGRVDRVAYWMRLIRRMRESNYDLILNFHASFRSSLTARFLRSELCVANHHELEGRNWFSQVEVPGRGEVKSVIDRDLDVLRSMGIKADVKDALPEVRLSKTELKEAADIFAQAGSASGSTQGHGPRVFLGIGGSRSTKRWKPEYFAEITARLILENDAEVVLATVPSDGPWLEKFWFEVSRRPDKDQIVKRIRHFSSKSLRDAAKIISQCSFYVGNDSGLKHLAAALGLKTVTFFGPEAPLEWHPYDLAKHPYFFIEDMPCRFESGQHWCSIPECMKHQHRCMGEITPAKAWPEILRFVRDGK